MTFRDDTRAVTVQVGAVLLFGMIIISMSMYQATVVPNQNEQVEFQHNQQVHDEFTSLRGAIVESASKATTSPSEITLGTRYPSRTFFVNPGVASGSLRTQELGTLSVSNVTTSDDEVSDYVSGTVGFSTKSLVYTPDYNLLQETPTTVYENSLAYNRFENGYNGTLSPQSLVDGRRISLVILTGNYSENGVGAASVDAQSVSPSVRSVPITSNDSSRNVTLTIPTNLTADEWETSLEDAGELDSAGTDPDAYVSDVRPGPGNTVVVELERGATYDLRIGVVGLGSGVDEPSAHYLTRVGSVPNSARDDATVPLTFEVRDRYNNPVSGETVNLSVTAGSGELVAQNGTSGTTLSGVKTDGDGRITVEYDPDESGSDSVTVRASADKSPGDGAYDGASRPDVTTTFDVYDAQSGGEGSSSYDIEWDESAIESQPGITNCDGDTCTYDLAADSNDKFDLEAFTTPNEAFVNVDFYANDSGVVTNLQPSEESDSNGDGVFSTVATVGSTGSVVIRVSSTSAADTLNLTVVDTPGGNAPPTADTGGPYTTSAGSSIELDGTGSSDSDGTITDYNWTITNDPTGDASLSNSDSATPMFDAPETVSEDTSITVELTVTDDGGSTDTETTTITVTDTPPSPSISMRVDDLTNVRSNDPAFVVSYDIGDTNASFERVEVEMASTESSASDSGQQTTQRGSVRTEPGYGQGQSFEVTVDVIYDGPSGEYVAESRTMTDTTDAQNPAGNDDLSDGSSASVSSLNVEDRTNTNTNNVRYRADYTVSSGDFSQVELAALNLNGNGATATTQVAARSRNNEQILSGDGAGTDYRVGILVYDDTGTVVDIVFVTDTADGTDP
ncbi:PKD domain-containing protein [Haloferax namakaokahaiae]|uniref:PKD domain-containing protein n=1 Tax=Haloferax namakaokahaiae TaxID=1748331 RepID=A0ABD5ZB00_9EURY